MKPFFTNNLSDVTQLEGLYVVNFPPPPSVVGVNLNQACVVGECIKGPLGVAVDVSPQRLVDVFGGRDIGDGYVSNLYKAQLNKAFGDLKVIRVAAAGAAAATHTTSDGYLKISAASVGKYGNLLSYTIADATNGNVSQFDLSIIDENSKTWTWQNLDIHAAGVDNTALILGDDYANPVILQKLLSGVPVNVSSPQSLSGGSNGTIADTDYTEDNGPIDLSVVAPDVNIVWIAEHMSATIKAKVAAVADTVSDRMFIICPDNGAVSLASAITEVASYRSKRIIYAFNHPWTLDPNAGIDIQVAPDSWMASILSQTQVDVNPGVQDNQVFTTGISRLTFPNLVRSDYVNARAAGMAVFEQDGGFNFVSGVNTLLDANGTGVNQINLTRETDFLENSIANSLKSQVKKKDTAARRSMIKGTINNFLGDCQRREFIVKSFNVDGEILNTDQSRAQNIEQILSQVKTINDMNSLVLAFQVGNTVQTASRGA